MQGREREREFIYIQRRERNVHTSKINRAMKLTPNSKFRNIQIYDRNYQFQIIKTKSAQEVTYKLLVAR